MKIFQKLKNLRVPTLFFSFSSNNTIASLVNANGTSLFTISSGHLGYKGTKKGTQAASQHLAFIIAQKTIKSGFRSLSLQIKGLGKGRNSVVKDLQKAGLSTLKVFDATLCPYNGCRIMKS